jgi:asparagine synthetase B (glutamine-hydrolysing)
LGAIFGILGSADPAELTAMGRRLVHRGTSVAVIQPAPGVWLGRLADRSGGDRESDPTRDRESDPTRPVVLDGFVDNAAELAREMGGSSDGSTEEELALELYRSQGAPSFARLRGQFALALWDERRRHLVLVRDPCGIRPLYVARTGERIAFASEYKALLALGDVPARPDRDAIAHVQRTKYAPAGASCLLDVRPVAPGSWRAFGEAAGDDAGDYRQLAPSPGARDGGTRRTSRRYAGRCWTAPEARYAAASGWASRSARGWIPASPWDCCATSSPSARSIRHVGVPSG